MNVMAVSTLTPDAMDTFLLKLAGSGVHNVAIVDSFGALYPYHVRYLVHKYMNYLGERIKVGVHFHNNQQQAFANSIAAIDEGVDFVDATLHGIGRGAGNCPLELCSSTWTTRSTTRGRSLTWSRSLLSFATSSCGDTTCPTPSPGSSIFIPGVPSTGWPALTGSKSARGLRRMPKSMRPAPSRLTSSWSLLTISAETTSRPGSIAPNSCSIDETASSLAERFPNAVDKISQRLEIDLAACGFAQHFRERGRPIGELAHHSQRRHLAEASMR